MISRPLNFLLKHFVWLVLQVLTLPRQRTVWLMPCVVLIWS